ncbi:MAG: hypothetical protein JW808_05865 [Victivallales bacterium]|nr:hypothetical protein [Victivallales bacterium]
MGNIFSVVLLFWMGVLLCGCISPGGMADAIDLSEGITITVTDEGDAVIDAMVIPVDGVLSKLEEMKVDRSDIILIKVSPRASQRPVMDILDQLGNAKYRNISISSDR